MRTLLTRLWQDESGQDLTEYALLLTLLALSAIATLSTLGQAINGVFANATTSLTNATT